MEPHTKETIYPNLKFGEITVQYKDNWMQKTMRYFNYETPIDATTNIIILFHDNNEILHTLDIVPDKTITYTYPKKHIGHYYPSNISIGEPAKKIYNRNIVKTNNGLVLFGFNEIYNTNRNTYITDASIYNCIYYSIDTKYPDLERVVFSILKRKYGIDSSRFLFSYDSEFMTKSQAANIIYNILTFDGVNS